MQAGSAMHKSHAIGDIFLLGVAMELQGRIWHRQGRLEEAGSEVLHAAEIFDKLGAARILENCRVVFQVIQEEMGNLVVTCEPNGDGEVS